MRGWTICSLLAGSVRQARIKQKQKKWGKYRMLSTLLRFDLYPGSSVARTSMRTGTPRKLSTRSGAATYCISVVSGKVGEDTFMNSLDCLRPLGLMVSFGNASGPVPPFNIGTLAQKGSLFLTRPTLLHYTASREDLVKAVHELFAVVKSGKVRISINQTYPLKEAAQAHRDLEARRTTGSTVLLP